MSTEKEISPSQLIWRKFKSNRTSLAALYLIGIFLVIAIAGPLIRPDASPKANDQHLELTRKSPGFVVKFLHLPKSNYEERGFFESFIFGFPTKEVSIPIESYSISKDQLIVSKYSGDSPLELEYLSYTKTDLGLSSATDLNEESIQPFIHSKTYLLGTDRYGRDLLSRLMAGCWISFTVGLISLAISLFIGITLGAIAGYFRGKTDEFIVWLFNVVWSVPTLLLVIAITLVLGKGFWQVFVAVGLTMWVEVARLVRGQVMEIREKEFVEAGRAFGYSSFRIILRHILPNISGPIIVISASNFAAAILIEAGLSFLGLGAQPPQATWGKMISEHKGYIITGDAYLAIFPGIAIFLLVLSFVMVGNGLRDAFDSKQLDV